MAHLRPRYATTPFNELLRFSPIIGVFGHRQAGKTTFLEGVCKEYRTLDHSEDRRLAEESPEIFLAGLHGRQTGIDECQLAPRLFPALKERIRKNKAPGQFILSGPGPCGSIAGKPFGSRSPEELSASSFCPSR